MLFPLLLVGVAAASAGDDPPSPASRPRAAPQRVLVVGNSLLRCSGVYVDSVLAKLAASADPPVRFVTSHDYASNTTLEFHWTRRRQRVAKGTWHVVVLQEHSEVPIQAPEKLARYVRLYDELVRKHGGRAVLLMVWPRGGKAAGRMKELEAIYASLADELNIPVAPAGLAWELAGKERPKLKLYKDAVHPSMAGLYLNACVLYATLTGRSPKGLGDGGLKTLHVATRTFLQNVAWQTAHGYQARHAAERQQPDSRLASP